MTFTQPLWFASLLVAVPLLLLLHTRRRTDVLVPNLFIWRQVQAAGATTPDPRRIRWRDPHLLLQLAIVCLAAVALAGPTLGRGTAVDHWVFLVDTSTSMNATDVAPSRLGSAVALMSERWGGQGLEGEFSLVQVGPEPVIVAARWQLRAGLIRATGLLEASQGMPDWSAAALRASQLLLHDDLDSSRIVVVTDAYGAADARAALSRSGIATERTEVFSVGGPLVNVGLADVEAVERGERPDQWSVSGVVVADGFDAGDVVRVSAAFRFPDTEVFLPWGAQEVTLDGAGRAGFAIPLDLPGPGDLRVSGPPADHLAVDDSVTLALRGEPVRVGVLGPVPDALLAALSAIESVEAYRIGAGGREPEDLRAFDLVVITETSGVVPDTSTLWLGSVPDGVGAGTARVSTVTGLSAGAHVLTADLDATALSVRTAQPLVLLAGAEPLLSSQAGVLAWARTTTSGRQVVVGFGLEESDWASQVSFPAFVAALVTWVSPPTSRSAQPCSVGQSCAWPMAAARTGSELLDPNGAVVSRLAAPAPIETDPLASAVWDQALFDAGFTPARSGAYQLVSDVQTVTLPVMAQPVGVQPPRTDTQASGATGFVLRPLWRWFGLAVVALVLVEAALAWANLSPVVRRRSSNALILTGLALVLIILALARVPLPALKSGGSFTWVGRPSTAARYERLIAAAPGWTSRWVSRSPLVDAPASDQAVTPSSPQPALGSSDLGVAIEMALASPAESGVRRIAVEAEGSPALTVTEAARLVARAAESGVGLDLVGGAVDEATTSEVQPAVRVESVEVPVRVRANGPFLVKASIVAPPSVAWTLSADLLTPTVGGPSDANRDAARAAQPIAATDTSAPFDPTRATEVSGTGSMIVDLEFLAGPPGELIYQLSLTQAGASRADAERTVAIVVGEGIEVLMIGVDEVQGRALGDALAAQGAEIAWTTPFGMPSSLEDLAEYDTVVLVNVPATELFPEYQVMLERYVRELGGGLMIFGGESSFGPGGYYATPLEDLSPLSSLVTDEAPEVAMALVLDRSGSMSGMAGDTSRMELAKRATLEALSLLGDESQAAIIVFDTVAHEVLPFTSVLDRSVFERALAGVSPAGGTAIYPALEAAYRVMAASEAATRHIVVMTDGLSQDGDFEGVIADLNALGVSTSFVGVGSGADRRQLSTLAGLSGGALHMALDFRALPSLLAQEALMLSAEPIVEGATELRWTGGPVPAFLSTFAETSMPALLGYVKTTAKPEATVHLSESAEDEAILASWRYGLGRVVAFASDADGAWSRSWTSDEHYGRLWSQLARWAGDDPVRDDWAVRVAGRSGVLEVLVDVPRAATDAHDLPFVELWDDDQLLAGRRLTSLAPGEAWSRFEVGPDWEGLLEVRIEPDVALGLPSGLRRTVPWPLAVVDRPGPTLVPLERVGLATGGENRTLEEFALGRVNRVLTWPERPQVWLLLALSTFLIAVALRYGVIAVPGTRSTRVLSTRRRRA